MKKITALGTFDFLHKEFSFRSYDRGIFALFRITVSSISQSILGRNINHLFCSIRKTRPKAGFQRLFCRFEIRVSDFVSQHQDHNDERKHIRDRLCPDQAIHTKGCLHDEQCGDKNDPLSENRSQ